jgi:hypothetical protein
LIWTRHIADKGEINDRSHGFGYHVSRLSS